MVLRFGDLSSRSGLAVLVRKAGLNRHYVEVSFGNFAGELMAQLAVSSGDGLATARALLQSITLDVDVTSVTEQNYEAWLPGHNLDQLKFRRTGLKGGHEQDEIQKTIELIAIPLLAAMAELIGYSQELSDDQGSVEGTVFRQTVLRRERNERNRLLALKIHGARCAVCGFSSKEFYGDSIEVIEVHHLEPVASLDVPRVYNPATDLIPLCPNCHRAVHSRAPVPYQPEELKRLYLSDSDD